MAILSRFRVFIWIWMIRPEWSDLPTSNRQFASIALSFTSQFGRALPLGKGAASGDGARERGQ
jgi:hypothetical protein